MSQLCYHGSVIFMSRAEGKPPTWHCSRCGADFEAVELPDQEDAETAPEPTREAVEGAPV